MKKDMYEKIINLCMEHGCDFSEVYFETSESKNYILTDSKLDDITSSNMMGVGIRVLKDNNIYYSSTNDLSEENLINITKELLSNFPKGKKTKKTTFKLGELIKKINHVRIPHDQYPIEKKVSVLKKIDETIRNYSPLISQVRVGLYESKKDFTVANSKGKFISSNEIVTRIYCISNASKDEKKEDTFNSYGKGQGYELLDDFDCESFGLRLAKIAVDKLSASKFEGGKVPVILGPGFGAIIFHEACGHALEATSVSENSSIFSNKLNQKIASEKVTLIDDGSISGEWGSTLIDSEGNNTRKNILIEKGILKSYLIDDLNSIKMNLPSTSSGRRQDYQYPPTSRMNNTYLERGKDKIEDMLTSIDYGIYCKSMRGGSVDTKTGDFNFSVDECYLIKKGKIDKMLTGVTLIGKGQEILNKVEMVSDDLILETGYCGSESGTIHVTVGQPTIKVSEILVGGQSE